MEKIKSNLKRKLTILALVVLLIVYGTIVMESKLELTGAMFMWLAGFVLLYSMFIWFLRKINKIVMSRKLKIKETWFLLTTLALLFAIGTLEGEYNNPMLSVVFFLLLVSVVLFSYIYKKSNKRREKGFESIEKNKIQKILFWYLFFGVAILLIAFASLEHNTLLMITSFFYYPVIIFIVFRWFFRQIKTIITLKNEKAKTELLHLKSQVNPHFFFNMLNNLYGLTGSNPKKAQELILKLSDMMRYSIYEGEKEFVTLEEEMDYLENYISLHKMRYHKDIDIKFDADIQENYKIMPLLFIILLENAFKHGVENLRSDAYVNINVVSHNNSIHFTIENNFDPEEIGDKPGIGLKNLKRRLELAYSGKYSLFFSTKNNIYKVALIITEL